MIRTLIPIVTCEFGSAEVRDRVWELRVEQFPPVDIAVDDVGVEPGIRELGGSKKICRVSRSPWTTPRECMAAYALRMRSL